MSRTLNCFNGFWSDVLTRYMMNFQATVTFSLLLFCEKNHRLPLILNASLSHSFKIALAKIWRSPSKTDHLLSFLHWRWSVLTNAPQNAVLQSCGLAAKKQQQQKTKKKTKNYHTSTYSYLKEKATINSKPSLTRKSWPDLENSQSYS